MKLARDTVITPERVSELLAARYPEVRVEAVDILSESEGAASRLCLAVRYARDADAGLPTALFVKRNLADFTFPPEMYLTECRFYRDLAPELSLETPAVYGMEVDESTGAFVLLMEDLAARGARLAIATDPVSPDEVASVLKTLAALHAPLWETARLHSDLSWLELPTTSRFVDFYQNSGRQLSRRHLESGRRAEVAADRTWVHDRVWTAFGALLPAISRGPRTVLHGDLHVGNTYFLPGGAGGVLDWQLMLQGSWSVDVAYMIQTALDAGTRAQHERELLRSYLSELESRGVDAPKETDAWDLYRQNAVWGVVMWLVTPDGVHTDAVRAISLDRCMTAVEELDTLDALRA
jgi:aminoglycoside phosphotransferase (APT) family kinase protein